VAVPPLFVSSKWRIIMTSEATQNSPVTIDLIQTVFDRAAECPNANFNSGMLGGGGGVGVGIADKQPDLTGNPDGWTLLDQDEVARTPQLSEYIGGNGLGLGTPTGEDPGILDFVVNDVSGNGEVATSGECHLIDLATGWEAVTPP
jgi:hypothetical protein